MESEENKGLHSPFGEVAKDSAPSWGLETWFVLSELRKSPSVFLEAKRSLKSSEGSTDLHCLKFSAVVVFTRHSLKDSLRVGREHCVLINFLSVPFRGWLSVKTVASD